MRVGGAIAGLAALDAHGIRCHEAALDLERRVANQPDLDGDVERPLVDASATTAAGSGGLSASSCSSHRQQNRELMESLAVQGMPLRAAAKPAENAV